MASKSAEQISENLLKNDKKLIFAEDVFRESPIAELNVQKSQKTKEPGDAAAEDLEAWLRARQLLRPDDQLDLTEAELAEDISKVLVSENTNVLQNLAVYSYVEGSYVLLPPAGNVVTLHTFEGTSIHLDSPEAKLQLEEMGDEAFFMAQNALKQEKKKFYPDEGEEAEEEGKEPSGDLEPGEEGVGEEIPDEPEEQEEQEEGEEAGEAAEVQDADAKSQAAPAAGGRKKKLINMFNFCERAALTSSISYRSIETQTVPPPRSTFGDNVLQWIIYDSYADDFAEQMKNKAKEKKGGTVKKKEIKKTDKGQAAEELNKKYLKCWQILERMINQNIYDDISQDYQYWEDPADEFREGGEGTLLPLWKFSYEKMKKMNVTDLMFNPHYYDLFAVCFGSHDFMKQSEGGICLFTIKNPSYPDYRITCESGVMCCDIHPNYPYLLAIGMYDGNVAVYNLQENYKDPLYVSQGVNSKHAEAVWEIKWGPDMPDGEINFYSVSTDGKVFNWILMQNKLSITTITTLFIENAIIEGPDGTDVRIKGCGTCMTFHPEKPDVYLVGTEEGKIYKCNIAYSTKYLMTYDAHYLSIYRIDFNKFNSKIFASCSGDWRIKVWEDMRNDPLFIFDLGSSVGDVRWAPHSSTVLAAVTTEGKVFVFDLNVNKYKAICTQQVVPKRKTKLTRICFNQKLPFIIVGDDKGAVTSLKLSPNLRLKVKPPKKQPWLDQNILQVQKLEKLLSLVRELPDGNKIKDTGTTVAS